MTANSYSGILFHEFIVLFLVFLSIFNDHTTVKRLLSLYWGTLKSAIAVIKKMQFAILQFQLLRFALVEGMIVTYY